MNTSFAAQPPLIRRLAIASLVSQVLIVVTGGAVRLTSSGLGCPSWPNCSPESLVSTPEMGIHGVIEFGNRTLTFVLTAIAVAMLVAVWKQRRTRTDLYRLSIALLAGIPAQAVIGGITVWSGLNPWVVGWHFIVSMALIALATVLVNRTHGSAPAAEVPVVLRWLLTALAVCAAAAIVLGVVVTGSGPHAGDAAAPRNGLDPALLTRLHVVPVYLMVAGTLAAIVLVRRAAAPRRLRHALDLVGVVVVVQGLIGYVQHFTGLPILLVALHMLGASLLTAATAHAVYLGCGARQGKTRQGITEPPMNGSAARARNSTVR